MECRKVIEENARMVENLIAAVRNRTPILKNPEGLTENIMKAIQIRSHENHFRMTEKSGKSPVITFLQRLMTAASVCLFLVFGYEQYLVVDKISRLEKQNATISQSPQYYTALKLKKAICILATDPEMLNRYKEIKTRKINLRTLLKAAIYFEVAGITPDAPGWLKRSDYHASKSPFMSILKQFDSTHYTIQR